jgi:23S rRNA pseudouridine2605 synthase
MRINRYIAFCTGMSRRSADRVISEERVKLNGSFVSPGMNVSDKDIVSLDGVMLQAPSKYQTIMLNKPVGYVVSRNGQGSDTIYSLLPPTLYNLKPVGRLDKDSSGLLLLSDDGNLTQSLTHPSVMKQKIYEIIIDKPLRFKNLQAIQKGIMLEDGISKLELKGKDKEWLVTMYEGRNRQIRRTFASQGYSVSKLNRIQFGEYTLDQSLKPGMFIKLDV